MNEDYLEALQEIILPLRTVEADDDFTDLEPFGHAVDGAQIIGLGESTHGTREFFQLKHRLTRYLVEKKGFRVFVIEGSTTAGRNIDDYVVMNRGNRSQALASLGYWTWDTTEVSNMIDWMREYNLTCAPGAYCRFLGCDQQPPDKAAFALLAYLRRVAGVEFPALESIVDTCPPLTHHQQPKGDHRGIFYVPGWLELNRRRLIAKSSPVEYARALEDCRLLCQYTNFHALAMGDKNMDLEVGNRVRDSYMAENLERILGSMPAGTKVILWAHNMHIAARNEWPSIGGILRQRYGQLYYSLALTFGRGTFQAIGDGRLQSFSLPAPIPGTWDYEIDEACGRIGFFDLRSNISSPAIREWASQTLPCVAFGGGFNPSLSQQEIVDKYCIPTRLSDVFDGVIHLKHASRARPNPTGIR